MILDEAARGAKDTPFDELGPSNTGDGFEVGPPPDRYGPGKPILCYMTGKNLAGAGPFYLTVFGDANIDGNFTLTDMTITIGPQAANAGGVTFALPSNVSNFVKFGLSGFTAGTFDVWVGVQTY